MSVYADTTVLSRSGVFHRLGTLLTDVSSLTSPEPPPSYLAEQSAHSDVIDVDTPFAYLSYRQDLSSIEHVHIRCRPASSFDPAIHTNLCEAVLGIYPETGTVRSSAEPPVIVRGVTERRHRRIRAGDWLLSINGTRVDWINLNDFLSKYSSTRKLRLTIRHPETFEAKLPTSSILSPTALTSIAEKKIVLPEQIDCIHSVLYYQSRASEGFELMYQQPAQKDLFFAAGGVFPILVQVMRDMNVHDSPLRR